MWIFFGGLLAGLTIGVLATLYGAHVCVTNDLEDWEDVKDYIKDKWVGFKFWLMWAIRLEKYERKGFVPDVGDIVVYKGAHFNEQHLRGLRGEVLKVENVRWGWVQMKSLRDGSLRDIPVMDFHAWSWRVKRRKPEKPEEVEMPEDWWNHCTVDHLDILKMGRERERSQ